MHSVHVACIVVTRTAELHEWCVHVSVFKVKRAKENGGDVTFGKYEDLEQMFAEEVRG